MPSDAAISGCLLGILLVALAVLLSVEWLDVRIRPRPPLVERDPQKGAKP